MTIQKNIYQRLNAVMLEVENVQKEDKKVNNMYRFVAHDAVSKALHMPMTRAGIHLVPTIAKMERDGNNTFITMDLRFVNIDDPSDFVSIVSMGEGVDGSDKGIGKAVSYAVKYGLLKMFCLETGDDVEKDNIERVPGKKATEKVANISDDQRQQIVKAAYNNSETLTRLCKYYNINNIAFLPENEFEIVLSQLEKLDKNGSKITKIKEA